MSVRSLAIGLWFVILGVGLHAAAARPGNQNPAAMPVSRMLTPWWAARFAQKQAELHGSPPDLVFLGDSITQDWEQAGPEPWRDFRPGWTRFYGGRHAVNLGFKGDSTAHLLWRMQNGELDGIAPHVAVVLIGANNFGHVHWNADQTVAGIAAIVAELHHRLPATRVLLISILPSERSAWVSANTAEANRALAARYGAGQDGVTDGVTWVDVTPVFAPGGRFDRSLFLDPLLTPPDPPLHPSAEGQNRLSAAIEPALARLLGDRPR